MSKMLTNFTFNLPFCCKVSHSGITSSAFSLPLSEKHIGAELASCLPPSPSATIILRYHPTFWPSSLWGGGEGKGRERGWGTHTYSYNTSHGGGETRTNLDKYSDRTQHRWRATIFPKRVYTCLHLHAHTHARMARAPDCSFDCGLPCNLIKSSPLSPPFTTESSCPFPPTPW